MLLTYCHLCLTLNTWSGSGIPQTYSLRKCDQKLWCHIEFYRIRNVKVKCKWQYNLMWLELSRAHAFILWVSWWPTPSHIILVTCRAWFGANQSLCTSMTLMWKTWQRIGSLKYATWRNATSVHSLCSTILSIALQSSSPLASHNLLSVCTLNFGCHSSLHFSPTPHFADFGFGWYSLRLDWPLVAPTCIM